MDPKIDDTTKAAQEWRENRERAQGVDLSCKIHLRAPHHNPRDSQGVTAIARHHRTPPEIPCPCLDGLEPIGSTVGPPWIGLGVLRAQVDALSSCYSPSFCSVDGRIFIRGIRFKTPTKECTGRMLNLVYVFFCFTWKKSFALPKLIFELLWQNILCVKQYVIELSIQEFIWHISWWTTRDSGKEPEYAS